MDSFKNFWNDLVGGMPDVLVALLVLIAAFIMAWLAKKLALKLVKMVGLDKAMSKAGIDDKNRKQTRDFIGQLVYLIVFVLFLPGIFEK